jgi:mono/diheme cytochrome c family protein
MRRSNALPLLAAIAGATLVAACARSPRAVNGPTPTGGTTQRASAAPAAPAAPAKPAAVTAANVALGDSLFNNAGCQRCHGMKGVGAANAPALDGKKWLQLKTGSFEEIVGIITTGVPATAIKDPSHRNPMGARGGRAALTDAQIQAVAAYVWMLSHP